MAIGPVEPDWNAIQERYLTGEGLATIAADYGTTVNAISIRAHREKWKAQQFKVLLADEQAVSREVRANLVVSCLRESRFFHELAPSRNPIEQDLWSKIRDRLVSTAGKLLHWEQASTSGSKHAITIDV